MKDISILGGGPAGLAVGYFAKEKEISFTIYEAKSIAGGNCVTYEKTIEKQVFRYDSGAHRLHDKVPAVTALVKKWLGTDLLHVSAPSQIYRDEKYVDFPLSPLNLMKYFGTKRFFKTTLEVGAKLLNRRAEEDLKNFKSFAIYQYGKTISETFLLGYSEKLWGLPTNKLMKSVAGNRMKGLTLKTFILESFFGKKRKTKHLDGAFYYPKYGYGMITKKMIATIGQDNIALNSPVEAIYTEGNTIKAIKVKSENQKTPVNQVVSTLPLPLFLRMMVPQPPNEILDLTRDMKFRNLLLVAIFLNKESITNNATIYFSDKNVPFTRVYEPRNRSKNMSPKGMTSLVVEIPLQATDELWQSDDRIITQFAISHLVNQGIFSISDMLGSEVRRMPYAYPILEVGVDEKLDLINDYLQQFENLHFTGRNGTFEYNHLHNLIAEGEAFIKHNF